MHLLEHVSQQPDKHGKLTLLQHWHASSSGYEAIAQGSAWSPSNCLRILDIFVLVAVLLANNCWENSALIYFVPLAKTWPRYCNVLIWLWHCDTGFLYQARQKSAQTWLASPSVSDVSQDRGWASLPHCQLRRPSVRLSWDGGGPARLLIRVMSCKIKREGLTAGCCLLRWALTCLFRDKPSPGLPVSSCHCKGVCSVYQSVTWLIFSRFQFHCCIQTAYLVFFSC